MTGSIAAHMTICASIVTIAIGAILQFPVTADLTGADLQIVGLILMLAGAPALAVASSFVVHGRG